MSSNASFYWYDLETSGTAPARDRIMQFAGVRTSPELDEIDVPFETLIPLPPEVLPEAKACLISGLTPQAVNASMFTEWQAVFEIERRLSQPQTTTLGYNNIKFDDEFIRFAFYRNFFDPYAREHLGGNSRADLLPIVLLCASVRPEGLEWPLEEDGPLLKLTDLAEANHIAHARAHDALSDVRATVGLAKLLRKAQPKLWDYAMRNRSASARALLEQGDPVVHVSMTYGKKRWCTAPVVAIAAHPRIKTALVACDLAGDIDFLESATPAEIRQAMFCPRSERTAESRRPPLVEIRLNQFPVVAPLETLNAGAEERIKFTKTQAWEAVKVLKSIPGLSTRVSEVYQEAREFPGPKVEEEALYDGFLPNSDRRLCRQVVAALSRGVGWKDPKFRDPRLAALSRRLRARERPENLSPHETDAHMRFVRSRLEDKEASLIDHRASLESLVAATDNSRDHAILKDLITHDKDLLNRYF